MSILTEQDLSFTQNNQMTFMQIIADLQLHSRFSRAVSPKMTIQNIAMWAKRKGIGLVATGDWTHPSWFREIEKELEEVGEWVTSATTR